MMFTLLLISTAVVQVIGDGPSVFQMSINRLFELPSHFFPAINFQPETLMNVTQIIRHNGYQGEEHSIITKDGYILGLQRIPPKDRKLPPILLMHGYFGYAGNFVSNTPDNAPAFLFAKAGFDVWLVNQRGTEYSRRHTTLNPDGVDYWKFSWDDIAAFDLPASIDYILNVTGHKQIIYVGHSLGGALPFALLATRPVYMNKIKAIYALAPLVDLANISQIIKVFAPLAPKIRIITDRLGIHEYPKYPPQIGGFLGKYFDSFVRDYVNFAYGEDCEQWNSNRSEVNLAHFLSSTNLNIYYHESQLMCKPGFRKFDWGEKINREKYGQPNPPDYDITGITVPTHIYYGDNDLVAPINNGQFLKKRLKNATLQAAGKHWNYVDFLWAKEADKEFYSDLIASIKKQ